MKSLLGFNIYSRRLEEIDFSKNRIINTINPHSYCMTKKDPEFKNVLEKSDILLPDGVGIVWASKVLNSTRIFKIAGFDLFQFLMKDLERKKGSCFFLGASQATLDLIHTRAAKEYPNVKVYSYSPPYKPVFSKKDSEEMIQKVNKEKPDILFVGMTAPKQEKWSFQYKDELEAKVICSIGAVFDFYAGTIKRSSPFWIKMGLEWLPRFLKEPKRLAERNLISTPKFILEVLNYKLKKTHSV